MNKILSMAFYIAMGLFFAVCSYGVEDKAVQLLFVILGNMWIMHGILINNTKDLHDKIDNQQLLNGHAELLKRKVHYKR